MKILKRNIPGTHIIITLLAVVAVFQFVLLSKMRSANNTSSAPATPQCAYEIDRSGGFQFIKPIVDAKQECESNKYQSVKQDIADLVQKYKSDGSITSASVYLQDFKQNDWISYNATEKYNPGSLLKVPLLMAYLRMDEDHPGLLDTELRFDKQYHYDKNPVFLSKAIQFGNKYTIRELLRYMIAYSDNNANNLLFDHVDFLAFQKVFTDLGISQLDWKAPNWPLTPKEYSLFMDAIFNASYLSKKNSEFASELLSQCDFTEGMRRSLPDSMVLIHKFAEAGNAQVKEFHESGIIYLHNAPYLLTIMTKGADLKKLPGVVSNLSKLVYDDMIRLSVIG
jgi:beta-lactamase class A